ncbi:vWA domain-containing protein [Hyphomicrobium sp. 2TAF46]|uniref:vWA domain-containing protein n=1 Tax=Hyphomicrobium sp. 2TAF46 TaxID=3233019 RepID=UPI003F8F7417
MTEATPEAQSPTQSKALPTKTAITMVLDRSGSMEDCRAATIESVNAYLSKSRNDDNLKDADFELAIFDTGAYEIIRKSTLSAAADISPADFEPRGGTPLLDAVGRGIDGLDKRAVDDKAILVVVTDGLENSSRKHSYESIKALLDERQKKGWLVLFLGAGLESAREGIRMGVQSANVASIALDEERFSASMAAMAEANARYSAAPTPGARRAYSASAKFSPTLRMAMGDATGGKGLVDDEDEKGGLKKLFSRRKKPTAVSVPRSPDQDTWSKQQGDAWNE